MGDANLTAAVRSDADTIDKIIAEIAITGSPSVAPRAATISVSDAAMEDRKKEGYF